MQARETGKAKPDKRSRWSARTSGQICQGGGRCQARHAEKAAAAPRCVGSLARCTGPNCSLCLACPMTLATVRARDDGASPFPEISPVSASRKFGLRNHRHIIVGSPLPCARFGKAMPGRGRAAFHGLRRGMPTTTPSERLLRHPRVRAAGTPSVRLSGEAKMVF